LISCITENEVIKNGLFPGPGANVSSAKGGGLSKTEHQFNAFEAAFGEDPDWQPLIALAKDKSPENKAASSKMRKNLAGKIKNRLMKYVCSIQQSFSISLTDI
ncbi:hypothetical protein EV361DRAFT_812588, partial [Lentinula raphanica]